MVFDTACSSFGPSITKLKIPLVFSILIVPNVSRGAIALFSSSKSASRRRSFLFMSTFDSEE